MDMKKVLNSLGIKGEEAKWLLEVEERANEDELRLMKIVASALTLGEEIQRMREKKKEPPKEDTSK